MTEGGGRGGGRGRGGGGERDGGGGGRAGCSEEPSFHTLSLVENVKKIIAIIIFLTSFRFVPQKISSLNNGVSP